MEEQLNNLSIEFTELIVPWVAVMISIVFFLWFKDYATGIAKGLKFKLDPHFQEGDEVWLENEPAVILKIGTSTTIFGIVYGRGNVWRFIDNEIIFEMKLEKIISDKIHYDSDTEQSRKLRAILALTEEQDDLIAKNRLKDLEQDEIIQAIESYNQKQDDALREHKDHVEKIIVNLEKEVKPT